MKLFLISQSKNRDYDTYSEAVVCAETEEDAINMHPGGKPYPWWEGGFPDTTWCEPVHVEATYIGEASSEFDQCVICASFHAG